MDFVPSPHQRPACLVPGEPAEPRQPQGRLVRLGRPQARRHAAQQLAGRVRRQRLGMGVAPRPVLPAQFPQGAARPQLPQPAGDRGAAGPGPLLARARRRRLPARRDRFRRPRPEPAQQPAAPGARGRRQRPGLALHHAGAALEQGPARADRAVPQAAARADRALRRQGGPGRDQRRRRAAARRRVHQWRRPRHRLQLRPAELPRHAQGHPRHRRSGWRRPSADGWGCWSFSNHDVRRAVTRWGGDDPPEGLRRLVPVLLGSLRGTVCLYQGEELGLEEAMLAFEQLKDPFGIAFWPTFAGRDGCRTPMPWESDGTRGRLHHRRALAADPREPPPPRRRRAAPRRRARSSTPPAPSSTGAASGSR